MDVLIITMKAGFLTQICEKHYTIEQLFRQATMICPACKSDMVVAEYNSIELDYCNNCHGVWFDAGELELFLKSLNLDTAELLKSFVAQEAKTAGEKRKCPICGQRMKQTNIGQAPVIFIDRCQRGHGLWFDGGELAQLLKQHTDGLSAGQDSGQQVISFLREVFKAEM